MSTGTVRTALAGLIAVFGCAAGASAQDAAWATKMFDTLSHDFGVVARGADVRHRFKVTNLYKQDVHISSVRTTCGCASAKAGKHTLKSREVGFVEVTLDTRRHMRDKESNVVVTFDAPLFAEVRIPIKAYIRTDVVLTPGSADFGSVEQGAGATHRIDVAYAGRDDWAIRQVRTNNEYLDAKVVETGRGGGRVTYDLFVSVKPTAPVGNHSQQIVLVTDDANSPYVPVLVNARVEPDMTVTPSLVSLGLLVPGKAKTFNVVIRGKKPFEIEKIECESDRNAFAVRMPDSSKPVHVLPITVTPPDTPGKFAEEFTVTVAGRPEALHFEAFGEIAPSTN